MKKVLFLIFAFSLVFISLSAAWYLSKFGRQNATESKNASFTVVGSTELEKLHGYSAALKRYAEHNQCNTVTAFLIDMKLESGSRRFFVYDLQNDSVVFAGLVTHGRCNENWLSGRKYGNRPGCGCTSLANTK